MSDVFVSYASADRARAATLAAALEEEGWSVWWDRTIRPGENFDQVIAQALAAARCVIVLWSERSVDSDWVKDEAQKGLGRQVLVPALIDAVEIPLGFGRVHAAHLERWDGDRADPEFRKLCDAVRAKAEGSPPPRPGPPVPPPRPAPPSGGGKWRWAAAALVAAIALGAFGWYSLSRRPVPTPDVVGPPIDRARSTLVSAETTVPSVLGMVRDQAERVLEAARLEVGTVSRRAVAEAAEGTVVEQKPLAGAVVRRDSAVDLWLAAPVKDESPGEVTVPAVVKLPFRQAQAQLEEAGLTTGEVSWRPTPNRSLHSLVVDQSPARNVTVPRGSKVNLTVLKYEEGRTEEGAKPDCVAFSPRTAALRQVGDSWRIVDGDHGLFDFGARQDDARQALNVITRYGMDQSCFVGRPQPALRYLLAGGRAPAGALRGEDCGRFEPGALRLENLSGRWTLVEANRRLFVFQDEADGRQALALVQRFGFTHSCYVGSPRRSRAFSYLRR